nr:protein disulfide-isomerase-like [Rhipicephalus microplus]
MPGPSWTVPRSLSWASSRTRQAWRPRSSSRPAYVLDHHVFAITSNDVVYRELGATKDGVMLFKKFDDRNTTLDMPITSESVQKFVQQNSLPLVVDFTNQNAPDVFSWPTRQYNVLFYSNKSADFEEVLANFRKAAAAFQHQVLFVTIDADNENSKYILWLFFVAEHEVPAQRFVNFQVDFMRYKPRTASLKAEDIKTFVQDVLDGKIKEGMPPLDLLGDSEAHPVELNVDDNFEEVVYDITKDVLVQYYTPQCPRCKLLVPMYEALAEKYKNRKDVVIAKIDITTNEVERIVVHYLPVFKLYKKNTNAPVRYRGEATVEELSKFIDTSGEYGSTYPTPVIFKKMAVTPAVYQAWETVTLVAADAADSGRP